METNEEGALYLLPSKKTIIDIEDMFTSEMKTISMEELFNPANTIKLKIDKNSQRGFDWTDENKVKECKAFFEKLFKEDDEELNDNHI